MPDDRPGGQQQSGTLSQEQAEYQIDLADVRGRASRPLSTIPRPFLRWAGSKRALLDQFVDVLPGSFRTYHEPFLGSGALFFLLRPERARLSDSCSELVETFAALKSNPRAVANYLRPMKPDKNLFYAIRDRRRSPGAYRRAADFIYLNKTCWNGLYRVNGDGKFNVPYGAPKTDNLFDEANLLACGSALRRGDVQLARRTYRQALAHVRTGDLVFLDPPYVTSHNNNGFVDYNEKLFSWADQVELARRARELADAGASVVVTNAHHAPLIRLYEGFHCRPLVRTSTLAGAAASRRGVVEALLWRTARNSDG